MRQDVYGVAYQEARSELLDIATRYEQLRQRKEHLEGVVGALGPLLGLKTAAAPRADESPRTVEKGIEVAQPAEEVAYSFEKISATTPDSADAANDPFQRRIRNALKFGSVTRDRDGLQQAI